MSELRSMNENHTVSFDRALPGNAERVWWHLTEPEGLRAWLADGHMEQRLGGNVKLRFHNDEALVKSNCGFLVCGVISCYEPRQRLAYSWLEASREAGLFGKTATTAASRVTFHLTRGPGRTLLSLTHTGLTAQTLSKMGTGWYAHLGLLANVLSEDADGLVAAQHAAFVRRGSYVESAAPGMRA